MLKQSFRLKSKLIFLIFFWTTAHSYTQTFAFLQSAFSSLRYHISCKLQLKSKVKIGPPSLFSKIKPMITGSNTFRLHIQKGSRMIKTPFSRMKTGIQYRPYFFISFVITIVLYAIFQTLTAWSWSSCLLISWNIAISCYLVLTMQFVAQRSCTYFTTCPTTRC